ncbi:hypothetical protein LIER_03935 [Lithospermum erythrorhizon]|uniref:Uncharacterized protein n=1 Tax=Lithospermum erythrorhizon TaxID=34254 RepID=A0AAV3NZL8_LITER
MLDGKHEESLVDLIREYKDIFAWELEDMLGINTLGTLHKLHVDSLLLKADAIRELQFPEWIANVALVKKSNGTWRMCTNFTSLKKVCPKDFYPLPYIVRFIDGKPRVPSCTGMTNPARHLKIEGILEPSKAIIAT